MVINSTSDSDGEIIGGRRATDRITRERIKKEANNGASVKEMITELRLVNKAEHSVMNIQIEWLSKFAWTIIAILITGIIGGSVGLLFYVVRYRLTGG